MGVKFQIFILVIVLFFLHLVFMFSDGYYEKEYLGKSCRMCIENGESYPCECNSRYERVEKIQGVIWIIPTIMIILSIASLFIPNEK